MKTLHIFNAKPKLIGRMPAGVTVDYNYEGDTTIRYENERPKVIMEGHTARIIGDENEKGDN